jgi:hypothetical protein
MRRSGRMEISHTYVKETICDKMAAMSRMMDMDDGR